MKRRAPLIHGTARQRGLGVRRGRTHVFGKEAAGALSEDSAARTEHGGYRPTVAIIDVDEWCVVIICCDSRPNS